MSPEKMVHMANQIAPFFKTQPGNDGAESVANHIRDYWDPRMRRQLCAYVDEDGAGLDAIAVKASRMLSNDA